ncbi:DUF6268 family outer membrane beta-barrel protein [Paraferrimonas sp. SM1919]|uniref:DUF6268 family outer membrane beta-barrel protein n=1 Tax=Paraferrimonas sp. SM1919 TaxID=2662263 RepID=UPI0013D2E922|nr:DUF6268 family outer membrane beta-barrel protein [Paraferrimonas sp. SM1919]
MNLLKLVILVTLTTLPAIAEEKKSGRPSWSYPAVTVSGYSVMNADSELAAGDSIKRDSYGLSLNYRQPISRHWFTSLSARYDILNFDFSSDTLFRNNIARFEDVKRYGGSLTLGYRSDDSWMYMLSPSFQYAYSQQANAADASSWGVVAMAFKTFKSGNAFGLGLAYLNDINDVRVMPYPVITWQINDEWKLTNPFEAGFTGRAGLEIGYSGIQNWQFGFGSAYRVERFLADQAKNTIEVSEVVNFLRGSYFFSKETSVSAYLGYKVASELELNDSGITEQLDPHGAGAVSFNYKF